MAYEVQSAAIQPQQRSDETRGRLGALTGLRFLAALAVVLDHYWTAFIWWNPATGLPSASAPAPTGWMLLVWGGGHGVDCFFVLSGFILAYTYVAPEGRMRGTRASFWVARLARIYPVYLVGLALDAVPLVAFRSHHLSSLLGTLGATPLLLQAWIPSLGTWNSWDAPGWSLSVEAFFYLVLPFILIWLARESRAGLWVVAGLSVALFTALPVVLIYLVGAYRPALWWWLDQVLYYNPVMRLPEFTVGVALGILFVRRRRQPARPNTFLSRLPIWDVALLMVALALAALQFVALPPHYPVNVLMLPLFAAAIVLLAQQRGAIARLLALPVCVWLGEVSYGIYIVHAPLWSWVAWIAQHWFRTPASAPILFPIYLAVVLATAGLSYRFVERPARIAIRSWWTRREAQRQAGAPGVGRAEAGVSVASSTLR